MKTYKRFHCQYFENGSLKHESMFDAADYSHAREIALVAYPETVIYGWAVKEA
jgi:hypothetical protein